LRNLDIEILLARADVYELCFHRLFNDNTVSLLKRVG